MCVCAFLYVRNFPFLLNKERWRKTTFSFQLSTRKLILSSASVYVYLCLWEYEEEEEENVITRTQNHQHQHIIALQHTSARFPCSYESGQRTGRGPVCSIACWLCWWRHYESELDNSIFQSFRFFFLQFVCRGCCCCCWSALPYSGSTILLVLGIIFQSSSMRMKFMYLDTLWSVGICKFRGTVCIPSIWFESIFLARITFLLSCSWIYLHWFISLVNKLTTNYK